MARFHATAPTGGEIDALGAGTPCARTGGELRANGELRPDVLPDEWRRGSGRGSTGFWIGRPDASLSGWPRGAAATARRPPGPAPCCTEPIQIFDCIEFNHRFRYGDVAGEIAFLAMDLTRLGRGDLALRFINAYLEESGDYEAVPLLDFYSAYRAFVRGKVLGFMVGTHPEAAPKARERLALAHRYTQRRPTPRLLITTGVVGSARARFPSRSRLGRDIVGEYGRVLSAWPGSPRPSHCGVRAA